MKAFLTMIYDVAMYACDVTGAAVYNICFLCKVSHINEHQGERRGWNILHRNDTKDYMTKHNGTFYGCVFGTREWMYGFMKIDGTNNSNYKWKYDCWHRETGHPKSVYNRDYNRDYNGDNKR